MHTIFSKYVDGGAVFEVGDVLSKVDYSEQATKTFALLANISQMFNLNIIQYYDNAKNVWEALCSVHKSKGHL
jgi:hypothetical protein